jgi:hypothetical protein
MLSPVEVVQPCHLPWREILVVISSRNEDRYLVGNQFKPPLCLFQNLWAQVPRVEQVSGKQDGIRVLLEDKLERCSERVGHIVLSLFETVLSMAEMDIGQMCDIHNFRFD